MLSYSFFNWTATKVVIRPMMPTTPKIKTEPVSGERKGKCPEKERGTKNPTNMGPKPLEILLPNKLIPFILARCSLGTDFFVAIASDEKQLQIMILVKPMITLKNVNKINFDFSVRISQTERGIEDRGTRPRKHEVVMVLYTPNWLIMKV